MAKKWHARSSHALSSGVAVLTLVSAGIAAASQGGVMLRTDGRGAGSDVPTVEAAASTTGNDRSSGGHVADGTEDGPTVRDPSIPLIPGVCEEAMASARVSMPAAGDTAGIQHAIAVVSANCAKAPQAQGLLNALDHLLGNPGGNGNPDPGSGGNGSPGSGGNGSPGSGGSGNPDPGSGGNGDHGAPGGGKK